MRESAGGVGERGSKGPFRPYFTTYDVQYELQHRSLINSQTIEENQGKRKKKEENLTVRVPNKAVWVRWNPSIDGGQNRLARLGICTYILKL